MALKINYEDTSHNVTEGFYGTFEEKVPKTRIKDRSIRKISYALQKLSLTSKKELSPFIIVGSPRSGTSILERKIITHPNVVNYPGEALDLWFPGFFPWRNSDLSMPPFWSDPEAYTNHGKSAWSSSNEKHIRNIFATYAGFKGKGIFVHKTAMAAFSIERIKRVFPKAKFIHIHRDGRAVALSLAQQEFARMQAYNQPYVKGGFNLSFEETLEHCCRSWNAQMVELTKQLSALPKSDSIQLSYEAFCENPIAVRDQILQYIGCEKGDSNLGNEKIVSTNPRVAKTLGEQNITQMSSIMKEGLQLLNYNIDSIV